MATLYTWNVFFPLSKGGGIINVRGDREIGGGDHLIVTTKNGRDEIKAVLTALRGSTKWARRKKDHYRLEQLPPGVLFDGLSHGLAFALAEFMLAHAPAPRPNRSIPVVTKEDLLIVATGEIDDEGKVLGVEADSMPAKIRAVLDPLKWPRGMEAQAKRKIFVLPKANERDEIQDDLQEMRDSGWEVLPIDSIDELAHLYDPPSPAPVVRQLGNRSLVAGVALGLAMVITAAMFTRFMQGTPALTTTTSTPPLDMHRSVTGDTLVLLPAVRREDPAPTLAYSGHVRLEIVPVRDDGSLGPVLAEEHPFVREDRVGLILTHTGSELNALAIIRSGVNGRTLAEAVLEPDQPTLRRSFDIRDLVGAARGPTLYVTDCDSDCTQEAAPFREWVNTNRDAGLSGRTGNGDGTAPLILSANLLIWRPE